MKELWVDIEICLTQMEEFHIMILIEIIKALKILIHLRNHNFFITHDNLFLLVTELAITNRTYRWSFMSFLCIIEFSVELF